MTDMALANARQQRDELGNSQRIALPVARGTFAYYCSRVLGKLHLGCATRYVFVELAAAQLPAMPRGYELKELTADDADVSAAVPLAPVRAWRFDQGCRCLAVYRGDQMAGLTWMVAARFLEDEVRAEYQVASDSCWDLGMEVLPAFRGSRAVIAVLAALRIAMTQNDSRRSISRIADHNIASLNAHMKLGCRTVGTAFIVRIGRLQLTLSRRLGAPHLSYSDASRPVFSFP
jgi:L-amino acid N-acyltransferase YncA